MSQPQDTKLARRLQKRGKWPNYSACLNVVQSWLVNTEKTWKEIADMIDRGELDPNEQQLRKGAVR